MAADQLGERLVRHVILEHPLVKLHELIMPTRAVRGKYEALDKAVRLAHLMPRGEEYDARIPGPVDRQLDRRRRVSPGNLRPANLMTAAELRLYFLAWCESRAEVERLAALAPSPAVDLAYRRAVDDEFYDRMNYRRLRARYYAAQTAEEK